MALLALLADLLSDLIMRAMLAEKVGWIVDVWRDQAVKNDTAGSHAGRKTRHLEPGVGVASGLSQIRSDRAGLKSCEC